MAKYWAQLERLAAYLLPGKPKEKQIWRRVLRTKFGQKVMKSFEASLRRMPDTKFESIMAELDTMDAVEVTRKAFKVGLSHLPKKRGGRRGTFSRDIRQRAIEDLGHELPRKTFAEAIDLVAIRYEMTPNYLRKVWKNRKRLRQLENEPKEAGR